MSFDMPSFLSLNSFVVVTFLSRIQSTGGAFLESEIFYLKTEFYYYIKTIKIKRNFQNTIKIKRKYHSI